LDPLMAAGEVLVALLATAALLIYFIRLLIR
jgi:hypothetical protein